jgi:hypothetical protein
METTNPQASTAPTATSTFSHSQPNPFCGPIHIRQNNRQKSLFRAAKNGSFFRACLYIFYRAQKFPQNHPFRNRQKSRQSSAEIPRFRQLHKHPPRRYRTYALLPNFQTLQI